jgi:hypothetical protein
MCFSSRGPVDRIKCYTFGLLIKYFFFVSFGRCRMIQTLEQTLSVPVPDEQPKLTPWVQMFLSISSPNPMLAENSQCFTAATDAFP